MFNENDKDRLELLERLKNKPELALFRLVQEIKHEVTKEIESIKEQIVSIIEKKIGEKISQHIFKNITQLKGNKGNDGKTIRGPIGQRGPEGKSIKGKDGKKGEKGDKPVAGVDYLLPKNGKDGEKGKDGINIKGEKGEAGSPDNPEEIRDKLKLLIGDERLPADAIKGLKQIQEQVILMGGDRGRRVWPRKADTVNGTLVKDTADTTGATWILPSISKPDREQVYVNGLIHIKGSSGGYTMTNNKKIVFNSDSIPDVDGGEQIIVEYEEDR